VVKMLEFGADYPKMSAEHLSAEQLEIVLAY
jgi:hypothetical protein